MQTDDLIAVSEFCAGHRVEMTFIRTLHQSGLIHMTMVEGTAFLPADELEELEKFVRWHDDLDINPAGIEALAHILWRVRDMQEEMRRLRNRLQRYESGGRHPITDAEVG
ncbi:MAG: chaperone modulator CbpM [Bacteroidota bacterium]|nr:chaperone modulator CbpM [Bacteroidota bacterium]MDP4245551.1 chaperone modulator CbpM [Bacteroidota bacterium]MDP4256168.1 chaperone modulator CbpM [Bacteroidota bacterium]MDP4257320.1 chaperone modulator CbpM [Bacteroidota bacterium]